MNRSGRLDLADVTELLRDNAPRLRDGELEGVKLRVLARAPKGPAMRSRLSITAALVAGILMSFSGVALGISGISASGSASTAQYLQPGQTPAGEQVPNGTTPNSTPSGPSTISSPGNESSTPGAVQGVKQQASSPVREIPFTGFLAIPVLVIGMALLVAGTLLRRKTMRA
jgi:hypothetical protein